MPPTEHTIRRQNLPFDIDVWCPRLAQFTFDTYFIPLTRRQAKAIVAFYVATNRIRNVLGDKSFSVDDIAVLRGLERQIDDVMQQNMSTSAAVDSCATTGNSEKSASNQFFLRLSGRSPKDAEPVTERRREILREYEHELESLTTRENGPLNAYTRLMAIAKVNFSSISSGKAALQLLLTSERVYTDLVDWLQHGEAEQIVLRKFDPRIRLDFEFRCYVHNGKINAISQYDHYGIYPHLFALKSEIQTAIEHCWANLHHLVGAASYCADFIYFPLEKECRLIELSPFLPCTGAALFNWKRDHDLLHNGPFEFRLNGEGNEGHENSNSKEELDRMRHLDEIIDCNWVDRWKSEVESFETYFDFVQNQLVTAKDETLVSRVRTQKNALFNWIASKWRSHHSSEQQTPSQCSNQDRSPLTTNGGEESAQNTQHALFVYGLLKRGFYWHQKFLSHNSTTFVGEAVTLENVALVVGKFGVPFVVGNSITARKGEQVHGELFCVTDETLMDIDDFMGVKANHFTRVRLQVKASDDSAIDAFVYVSERETNQKEEENLNFGDFKSEYTLTVQQESYNPVMHMQDRLKIHVRHSHDSLPPKK